jgi:hypothetical protein
MWNSEVSTDSGGQRMAFRMLRGSTAVNVADANSNRTRSDIGNLNSKNGASIHPASATFLDSPSTTSQLTYNLQVGAETGGNTLFVNKAAGEADSDSYYRSTSNIVLIEVAA